MKKHQKNKPSIIVKINGKEVCKAGICGNGSLNSSLHCNDILADNGELLDPITFDVSGIFDNEYYTWFWSEKLKTGDEITIKIADLDEIDEPIEVSSIDDCILNQPWWKFWKKNKIKF